MTAQVLSVSAPKFSLTLSAWDRRFPPIYSKRVLCFSLPSSVNKEHIVSTLHIALQALVQDLPFLAGSVVPLPKERGGAPWLRDVIPQGAVHLVVKDLSEQVSWSSLRKANFSPLSLKAEDICPFPNVSYAQDNLVAVCRFQANFIDGGLLLVASIIHCVCDGIGVTHVLKAFAEKTRQAFAPADAASAPVRTTSDSIWTYDRSNILTSNGLRGSINGHSAWTTSPVNAHIRLPLQPTASRAFHLTADALARLKRLASTASTRPAPYVSTHDALIALFWRAIILSRHRASVISVPSHTTHLTQAIDCRARLGLPQPYYGNAIYCMRASISQPALVDVSTGLAAAARAIRSEILNVTPDTFRDLLAFAQRTQSEAHTRLIAMDELTNWGVMVKSYWGMEHSSLNFGGDMGHVHAFQLPEKGLYTGMQVIMPKRSDGSCDVVICESQATLDVLRKDQWFGDFVEEVG